MSKVGRIYRAIFVRHLAFIQRTAFRGTIVILFCVAALPAFGQTSVLTQHNDNARTGQNTSETILNTSNVNANQFGKLFAMPTDAEVYAQPLYVPGVTINGAVHNVVVIATENDSVYAYDAGASGVPLWKASMVDAAHGAGAGETALNNANTINCSDMQTHIGITSTPVIDPTSETIYVEAKSTNGTNYFHRLHALDLRTGNEKTPGPVVIDATVSGTGDGSSNGQLVFHNFALYQLNRPGLLLLNGTIYIAYASHCDFSPYHGWLFAYDKATFTLKSVYVTTPNGGLGGFWMSGAGVAADASGNIFVASGNGDFDTTHVPAQETGDTILKLGTTNQILTQLDYFTPQDQANLQGSDLDLGSGGVLILPDQPGSFPHILVQAGKEGRVYVVNRDQMTTNNSHYCSGCSLDPEIIEESGSGAVGWVVNGPAYWNNTIYFWGSNNVLKSIPISNGLPDFTHVTGSTPQVGFPGPSLSISSNATTAGTGIVWAINATQYGSPGPAVLYAYDATNVATMLFSSAQNAARDAAGNAVKFAVPTIANGKVYVGTSTAVDVYGLLSVTPPPSITSLSPTSGPVGTAVTITGTNFGTSGTVRFNGTTATTASWTSTSIATSVPTGATSGNVVVTVGGIASNGVPFTVPTSGSPTINYGSGFTAGGLNLLGSAKLNGTALRLTDGNSNEAGAAWYGTQVNIQSFTTDFTFLISGGTNPTADGLTFTIQRENGSALGNLGGALGYGPSTSGASGIPTSVAVKFDLYSNNGEGVDSTGLYTDGAWPTTPAVDMSASGVNLHSGDPFHVHMSYDGTNLVMTITDTTTNGSFSHTWPINIPTTVGGNVAYVGFTGGTGGQTAIQDIQTWTLTNASTSTPTITSLSPTSGAVGTHVTITGTNFGTSGTVRFNGTTATTASWTSTSIATSVPTGATSGNVVVTVGGVASNTIPFTVTSSAPPPSITSLSPTSGPVGTAVTITGTNFGTSGTVRFNGTTATTASWTSTSIATSVPTGATSGNVVVTVGGVASNGVPFTVTTSGSPTINYGSGFTAGGLNLLGSAKLNGTALRLTDGNSTEAGAAWYGTQVNIQNFTTDFTFLISGGTNPTADGFTFAIQGENSSALGNLGGALGYGPSTSGASGIPTSVAVKFDLYSNNGEGVDSTGLYTDGAWPTTPAVDMSGSGVNLHSGDPFHVHMSYDGTNLVMTITDTTTNGSFSHTWPINIPTTVGGNVAYVGFTGGAGGQTAIQDIQTWTLTNASTSTPTITSLSPTSGAVGTHVTITGTNFGTSGTVRFNGTTATTTSWTSTSIATSVPTGATSGNVVVTVGGVASNGIAFMVTTPTINYGSGFTAGGMNLLGSAKLNGTALRLTDGGSTETGAAWYGTQVNIQSFTTDFTFLISGGTNPTADGLTFTIQRENGSALGNLGGALGYGPSTSGASGIPTSVAVKFDLYSNNGEGVDSTGLYTDGAWPTTPAVDMSGSGVNLHSGDPFHVHMSYDGTNLVMTITDTTTNGSFSHTWPINIPTTVGGNVAYVGFTGGTGGQTAIQDIQTWTFVAP